jgi:hypothetical protein
VWTATPSSRPFDAAPRHENRTFPEPDTFTIELSDRVSSSSADLAGGGVPPAPDVSRLTVYDPGLDAVDARCRHGAPLTEHPTKAKPIRRKPAQPIDQTLDPSNDECNCTSARATDASFAPLARSAPPGAPR